MTKKIFSILLFAALLVSVVTNGLSRTVYNGAGIFYVTGDDGIGENADSLVNTNKIEQLVINSAVLFLEANQEIQSFLAQYEGQDADVLNFQSMQSPASAALSKISQAVSAYNNLAGAAKATPYNWGIIYRLWFFDYDGYMYQYGLNRTIFRQVKGYLWYGDINGVFDEMRRRVVKIESLLEQITASLNSDRFPELDVVWTLNETLSETSLFGSYVARVFKAIK